VHSIASPFALAFNIYSYFSLFKEGDQSAKSPYDSSDDEDFGIWKMPSNYSMVSLIVIVAGIATMISDPTDEIVYREREAVKGLFNDT